MGENAETNEMVNGSTEQRTSSKESSPIPSPTADRKSKSGMQAQTAATLPAKTQDMPSAQFEGVLHRKHEWETHNKKASNRCVLAGLLGKRQSSLVRCFLVVTWIKTTF